LSKIKKTRGAHCKIKLKNKTSAPIDVNTLRYAYLLTFAEASARYDIPAGALQGSTTILSEAGAFMNLCIENKFFIEDVEGLGRDAFIKN
jgi:hypothetical protein